jgi:hypothetical protein
VPVLMQSFQGLPHPGLNPNHAVFPCGKNIINVQTLRKNYRSQRRRASQNATAPKPSAQTVTQPVPKKRRTGPRKGNRRKKYNSMLSLLLLNCEIKQPLLLCSCT